MSAASGAARVVIFLDVDGVLLPVSPMQMGGGDLDESCLARLKTIVGHCPAPPLIILSSTWRHDEAKKQRLQAAFDQLGGMPSIAGGVPDGVANPTVVTYLKKDPEEQKLVRDRVDEIFAWIDANAGAFPFARERWFAIDDMDLGVDPRMRGHFVKTDIEEGLTRDEVAKAATLIETLPTFDGAPEAAPTVSAEEAADEVAADPQPAAAAASGDGGVPEKQQDDRPRLVLQDGVLPEGIELHGTVKRYNATRGFGFITTLTAPPVDVFVHQSSVVMEGFRGLNVGAPVSFVASHDGERLQALQVHQHVPYIPHLNGQSIDDMTPQEQKEKRQKRSPSDGAGGAHKHGAKAWGARRQIHGRGGVGGGRAAGRGSAQAASANTTGTREGERQPRGAVSSAAMMHGGRGHGHRHGARGAAMHGLLQGLPPPPLPPPPPPPPQLPQTLYLYPNPTGTGLRTVNGTVVYAVPESVVPIIMHAQGAPYYLGYP